MTTQGHQTAPRRGPATTPSRGRALAALAAAALVACTARGELGFDGWPSSGDCKTVDTFEIADQELQGLAIGTNRDRTKTYAVGSSDRAPSSGKPPTWVLRSSGSAGQTFETVFSDEDTDPEYAYGLHSRPGELYVVGNDPGPANCPTHCPCPPAPTPPTRPRNWVVRKSVNEGATWTVEDDWAYAPSSQRTVPFDIGEDPDGNLWVVGYAYTGCGFGQAGTPPILWVVRKRDAGSGQWSTVDEVGCAGEAGFSSAYTVIGTQQGVYVGGACAHNGPNADAQWRWQIRRTTDEGASWELLDDFALVQGQNAVAVDMLSHGGALYAVGSARDASKVRHWIVRKSTNGGASWTTVDNFRLHCGGSAAGLGIEVNESGDLYVVGNAKDGAGAQHWVVRKSTDQGATWRTVDQYQLAPGATASAIRAVRSANGEILVTGRAKRDDTNEAMVVRACK